MPRFVVAIPVAPGSREHARATDLLAALHAHERLAQDVVVVDDEPGGPRQYANPGFPRLDVIANPRAGRGIPTLGGTCTATLAALAWANAEQPGGWVLRMDSDALVIGPFARAIDAELRPGDGILGSCRRTCNDEPRDVSAIAAEVRRHARPVWTWRRPPRRPWFLRPAQPHVRGLIREARRRGYDPGEHCIAAACAISAEMVAAMAGAGMLEAPRRWLQARLGDDMMLGIQARALGLQLRDFHAVFGLKHVGLADTPQRLVDRGFAIVHSVKNDPAHPEDDVRAFFAARRPA